MEVISVNEALNNAEVLEFDEATLKMIAKKYALRMTAAIFTVIIALIAIVASIFYFAGNCEITTVINRGNTHIAEENYSAALDELNAAQKLVDTKNSVAPLFRTGDKNFWKKIEVYEKTNGPLKCKALLDKYYPDSKYPAKAVKYLDNAKIFAEAYDELRKAVYFDSKDYSQAYEAVESIAAENPDYPEYLVLYFHLLATQAFEESAASVLAAYNALEKNAPDEKWLYATAGTKALIKNNELNKALRLCPDNDDEETRALRIKIYRLMGEYQRAGMLYDEYRDYDVPSEMLDREKLILGLLEGDARTALSLCSFYTSDLNNCKSIDMIYTLWIASIKASDKKLEKRITDFTKSLKIPNSEEVTGYKLGDLNLSDIFLDGESDLS